MKKQNLIGFYKKKTSKLFFRSKLIKIVNRFLSRGLKIKAVNFLSKSLMYLKREIKSCPLVLIYQTLRKIMPLVELKNVKRGSTVYQTPSPLSKSRQLFFAISY